MPPVPKVGSRVPACAINEVGKARAAKDMRNTRSFGEATFFVKFDNNAVDILFGFIIHGIDRIRIHRNIPMVTLSLLAIAGSVAEGIDNACGTRSELSKPVPQTASERSVKLSTSTTL